MKLLRRLCHAYKLFLKRSVRNWMLQMLADRQQKLHEERLSVNWNQLFVVKTATFAH